jgi:uncharacterized membrane protein
MHPFYGPSQRLLDDRAGHAEGIGSMAAYLAFWAVVVVIAKREVDLRWPRVGGSPDPVATRDATDPALEALRARYARGEIDRDTFLAVRADLTAGSATERPS